MPLSTFYVHTLGCKLNFSESSAFVKSMQAAGFVLTAENEAADIFIINTCAVTAVAEKKCRTLVHAIKRKYPFAKIALMGCFSELEAAQSQLKTEVDIMVGSSDKMSLVQLLQEQTPQTQSFFSAFSSNDRTRSFLKIQDGCDYHCSYCTVAKARGESRSDTIEGVLKNLREIIDLDIKEVVLAGVNLGDFGRKNGASFYELLQNMLTLKDLPRIRISSIEPNLLTDDIIALVAGNKPLMPHFHIPLQSGNDRILALMKRRYNTSLFAEKVHKIKEKMPFACVAADVITGFPTETEEDFEITYHFLQNLPVDMLHVFSYSKRPGTPAVELKPQVAEMLKRERTHRLITLSDSKKENFYRKNSGRILEVLWESQNENGLMSGFTENYIKVATPYRKELVNTVTKFSF